MTNTPSLLPTLRDVADTCGCCAGIQSLTPVAVENSPGLPALAYRAGTHGRFKASMASSLSRWPSLRALTSRDDDDPTIGLLDAWASVLDVLTFYQERIANEGYLRTATETRSVLELARAIGYELSPGVAASAYLAFTVEDAPGAPGYAIIDAGAKVQSVPGPGDQPQTFETVNAEPIEVRAEWNAMRPRLTQPQTLGSGCCEVYLKGIVLGLKPGDYLLFVGSQRETDPTSDRWDLRRAQIVEVQLEAGRTKVTWENGLGTQWGIGGSTGWQNPKVYALRQRAALFGYNAPDWHGLPYSVRVAFLYPTTSSVAVMTVLEWPGFDLPVTSPQQLNLDAAYPQIVPESWLALAIPDHVELYRVAAVAEHARAEFMLTGKSTLATVEGGPIGPFTVHRRETAVLAQSEELELAEMPIAGPLPYRDRIDLDQRVQGLTVGSILIVTGKRVRVKGLETALAFQEPGFWNDLSYALAQPSSVVGNRPVQQWFAAKAASELAGILAGEGQVTFLPAEKNDPFVSEVVDLDLATDLDDQHTSLKLKSLLKNLYDTVTVTISANVVPATHGETRREVLGSGDGSRAFQAFALKQTPLTYVPSPTAGGALSTLQLRVNDLLWDEKPGLYGLAPRDHAYIVRIGDDGRAIVEFGDGTTGARLPTGTENVVATYRVGTGLAGLVRDGQLSLLMTRPLGVKGVTNPLAATGAADPEKLDDARANAPFTVRTIDRIVSLTDFADFARAFAGIGKAQATWLWSGEKRLVHITVAAANGDTVDKGSILYRNLVKAVNACRDPLQQVLVDSYQPLVFGLAAEAVVDVRYDKSKVLAAVRAALLNAFSFTRRDFGQAVTWSEVVATMQAVEGVEAVFLKTLHVAGEKPPPAQTRLIAHTASWDESVSPAVVKPAQLLTADPDGLTLTEAAV
jgi:hypothetical protein